ncbi:diguanylate cyclase domain-containing protein [Actinoplanes sp. NPDC049316]|uniref:diguanylate cyclase domain-containing protein n=1 Tax=Actinoplanes sp. NPDC049316 TaxID=3154727 RepID=UPI003421AA56
MQRAYGRRRDDPRPARLARAVLLDPLVLAVAGVSAAAICWLLAGPGGLRTGLLVRAGAGVFATTVLSLVALRVARAGGLSAVARRFWWAVTLMGALLALGNAGRVVAAIAEPGPHAVANGAFQRACIAAGVVVLLVLAVTYRRPAGRPAELRFVLDAVSVVVAAVVVVWFMADRAAGQDVPRAVALTGAATALVIAGAVARLLACGSSPMRPGAAVPVLASMAIQCFSGALLPSGTGSRAQLAAQVASVALASVAPRVHEILDRYATTGPCRRQRAQGLLPYAMLGVVFLVLPAALPRGLGATAVLTVAGLFVSTALVVARQLLASGENETLVSKLDASLLTVSRQEERVRLMLEYSTDITSLIDANGAFMYVTPATRALGYEPEQVLGVRVVTLIHEDDLPALWPELLRLMATPGATYTYQARYRHADGSWRWLEVMSRNLTHEPSVGAVVSNARDVTEARELQDRLRHEATHDPLTGLANRKLFGDRLAAEAGRGVALLHADLDGFKPVNDTYGHHVGDAVLVEVARRLRAALPPDALAARLGGDEFAALLPGAGAVAAEEAAQRFRAALDEPVHVDGHTLRLGVSVGVVAGAAVEPDALLRAADEAMYRVKHGVRR